MSFSNPVVGGENGELIRASIQSPDYVADASGWSINRDGSAEFNDIAIRDGAIIGGDIVIGPDNMPQVVIDSNASEGFIEFPTNDPAEVNTAVIKGGIVNNGLPFESLALDLEGPSINASEYAYVSIRSERQDGSGDGQNVEIGVNGSGNKIIVDTTEVTSTELFINGSGGSDNYPVRVVRGIVGTGSTSTTISKVSNTNIASGGLTSVVLENGVAYEVTLQFQTRSSAGSSAAGTQGLVWRVWEGTVGSGTVLGSPIEKFTTSVGTNPSSESLTFVFHYTGTTGSKSLNFSASHFTGTDTVQVLVNTRYFALVKRIGRPSNITNL